MLVQKNPMVLQSRTPNGVIVQHDSEMVTYFIKRYAKTGADADDNVAVNNDKRLKVIVDQLVTLYRSGPGAELPSAKGTAWGLVNAVTRFEDYQTRARSDENRFNSGQFGAGANRKSEAFSAALALAA